MSKKKIMKNLEKNIGYTEEVIDDFEDGLNIDDCIIEEGLNLDDEDDLNNIDAKTIRLLMKIIKKYAHKEQQSTDNTADNTQQSDNKQ